MKHTIKAAIIGSGNIGTDLMYKILRQSKVLTLSVMVGIDAQSDGLAHAKKQGILTTHTGVEGLVEMEAFSDISIVFDATSAGAHIHNEKVLRANNPAIKIIDLTPAAIGPFCIPVVNINEHIQKNNINMVTCGGQATIPIVAAVSQVATVNYAEIIACVASKSAGPGTRANIDEFTETTAKGIEIVGGAKYGKAIIILNPADPPMMMRDTVYVLSDAVDTRKVEDAIHDMVSRIKQYVPGYSLKQQIQFEHIPKTAPILIPGIGSFHGLKTAVYLEVKGAAHYLPDYAGNLDIMTSAALVSAEKLATTLPTEEKV